MGNAAGQSLPAAAPDRDACHARAARTCRQSTPEGRQIAEAGGRRAIARRHDVLVIRKHAGVRPAFSVIFLTTLIGAGQGLFLALYALELGAKVGILGATPEPRFFVA